MGTTRTQITRLLDKDIEAHARMLWQVEPDGTGSKVTVGMEVEPAGFFGTVTSPILARSIKDNFGADLARLKAYVEKAG